MLFISSRPQCVNALFSLATKVYQCSILYVYWPFVGSNAENASIWWQRHAFWNWQRVPAQRPVTRSFDVFFDLHPNKRSSKQSWGWLFETLSRPLWPHRNEIQYVSWNIHPGLLFFWVFFLCVWLYLYSINVFITFDIFITATDDLSSVVCMKCVTTSRKHSMINYRLVSNISRTKSPHLKDSRTVLWLSLPNPLKPDVKSRMKM